MIEYRFELKIDNNPATWELMDSINEIIVDTSRHLPDMFTLHIFDDRLTWVDSATLGVGKSVEITAIAQSGGDGVRQNQRFLLMRGEITGLQMDFTAEGRPSLLVRGYDRIHRLHRGKHSRSFQQATDSAIAQKIAQELRLGDNEQLKSAIDTTDEVYEYVFQDNLTNLEFLLSRSQRIGYQVYVDDNVLHFQKGLKDNFAGATLKWREELRSFRPTLTTFQQVGEVEVRSWDPQKKEAIVGQAQAAEAQRAPVIGGEKQIGGNVAERVFFPADGTQSKTVVVDRPVNSTQEATTMARALNNDLNGEFIQAEGLCFGNPQVMAGKTVTIAGVGTRFSGAYFVTSATHIYTPNGYETVFSISGRNRDTLSDLLEPETHTDKRWGLVTGLVTNIRDPLQQGRVKVEFPWLTGDPKGQESTWARVAAPMAGDRRGFFALPKVKDEVLVGFEHGDIHRPYILGVLWNGKDKPPVSSYSEVVGSDGHPKQWLICSPNGQTIALDDAGDRIVLRDKDEKNQIVINAANNKMSIEIKTGGDLNIAAKGVTIASSGNNLSIKTDGNLNLEAQGNVTIQGKRIDLN